MSKQYGLIIPGKTSAPAPKPRARLTMDDDDEPVSQIQKARDERIEREARAHGQKKLEEVKAQQAAILAEDPNAFAYDEVYDDIKGEKEVAYTAKVNQQKNAPPKYRDAILARAKEREREQVRLFKDLKIIFNFNPHQEYFLPKKIILC